MRATALSRKTVVDSELSSLDLEENFDNLVNSIYSKLTYSLGFTVEEADLIKSALNSRKQQ